MECKLSLESFIKEERWKHSTAIWYRSKAKEENLEPKEYFNEVASPGQSGTCQGRKIQAGAGKAQGKVQSSQGCISANAGSDSQPSVTIPDAVTCIPENATEEVQPNS